MSLVPLRHSAFKTCENHSNNHLEQRLTGACKALDETSRYINSLAESALINSSKFVGIIFSVGTVIATEVASVLSETCVDLVKLPFQVSQQIDEAIAQTRFSVPLRIAKGTLIQTCIFRQPFVPAIAGAVAVDGVKCVIRKLDLHARLVGETTGAKKFILQVAGNVADFTLTFIVGNVAGSLANKSAEKLTRCFAELKEYRSIQVRGLIDADPSSLSEMIPLPGSHPLDNASNLIEATPVDQQINSIMSKLCKKKKQPQNLSELVYVKGGGFYVPAVMKPQQLANNMITTYDSLVKILEDLARSLKCQNFFKDRLDFRFWPQHYGTNNVKELIATFETLLKNPTAWMSPDAWTILSSFSQKMLPMLEAELKKIPALREEALAVIKAMQLEAGSDVIKVPGELLAALAALDEAETTTKAIIEIMNQIRNLVKASI